MGKGPLLSIHILLHVMGSEAVLRPVTLLGCNKIKMLSPFDVNICIWLVVDIPLIY